MELADFGGALGADCSLSSALNRNSDLSFTQLGIEGADFGRIQGNFDFRRYRFYSPWGLPEAPFDPAPLRRGIPAGTAGWHVQPRT